MADRQPEREYDAEGDTWASWWLAHAPIGEMVRAMEPLHPLHRTLFVPAGERGAE